MDVDPEPPARRPDAPTDPADVPALPADPRTRLPARPKRARVTALVILGVMAAALFVVALARGGPALPLEGVRTALELLATVAPQLLLGFLVAGLLTVVLPSELIARWVGHDSGFAGLLIATVAGALTPGGPFMQFPLVATLANAGAGPGPLAAYLTAWSIGGVNRVLVWEIPFLGTQFALARWLVSMLLPPIVGLLVPLAMRVITVRA